MQTIAITGASGFIGTFLTKALLEQGYNVRILSRHAASKPIEGARYFICDYMDIDTLRRAFSKADIIVHLAAGLFCISKNEFYKANALTTANVAKAAISAGAKKIIYQSSLAAGGPSFETARTEAMEDKPSSYYGKSKLEGERYIKQSGLEYTILRAPIVYGGAAAGVSVISDWVRRGLMLNAGSGKGRFSFIYVKDLVRAQIKCIQSDICGTFYVCEKKDYLWHDFINMLAAGMGRKAPLVLNMPMPIVYGAGFVCELFSLLSGCAPMLNRDKAREAAGPNWTASAALWEKTAKWDTWTELKDGIKLTFAAADGKKQEK